MDADTTQFIAIYAAIVATVSLLLILLGRR